MTSPVTSSLHDSSVRGFASDNYSGVHPEVLAALAEANGGHQVSYGEDQYTERLGEVVNGHFGPEATIFPVFNGTGANVTALQSMLPRWGAVICATTAHINSDENGAPERVGGMKLLSVPTPDGKLTPELIDREAWGWGDEHRAQPLAVSLTQSTELGTLYTLEELRAITAHAHSLGMRVHMDGARISNAAAALGVGLGEMTTGTGIDILSLGGTKNGIMFGEGIVTLSPGPADSMKYLRKMNMQLASKMRFISAQLLALYDGDLWLRLGRPRQRHGREAQRRGRPGRRRGACLPDAGQRRLRRTAQRRGRRAARAFPLLRLGPRRGPGPLDVLLRHHRGRRRRLCRGAQGRNVSAPGLTQPARNGAAPGGGDTTQSPPGVP